MSCCCRQQETIVDVTKDYSGFVSKLGALEFGDWVKLMRCPECGQLWKVDEWDKYQTLYALKVPSNEGWKKIDSTPLIKERMVRNRGGLESSKCMWDQCSLNAVKGSAYCVNHLYDTGARA